MSKMIIAPQHRSEQVLQRMLFVAAIMLRFFIASFLKLFWQLFNQIYPEWKRVRMPQHEGYSVLIAVAKTVADDTAAGKLMLGEKHVRGIKQYQC